MAETAHADSNGRFHASLEETLCDGRGLCFPVCKHGALLTVPGERMPLVDAYDCTGCGDCVTTCPTGALQIQSRIRV